MPSKAEPPKPRPVGRPNTLPAGAKRRAVFLTDAEWAALLPAARERGITRNEMMRRVILEESQKI